MPPEIIGAVRICYAEKADFEKVFPLLGQLWPDRELDYGLLEKIYGDRLAEDCAVTLCAWSGPELWGFAAGDIGENFYHAGKYLHMHVLVVDEKKRGTHVGTCLLDSVIAAAGLKGCRAVELDSNFHRQDAHGFYEHRGFVKRGFVLTMDL